MKDETTHMRVKVDTLNKIRQMVARMKGRETIFSFTEQALKEKLKKADKPKKA